MNKPVFLFKLSLQLMLEMPKEFFYVRNLCVSVK